jgi:acetyltransferase-like isoleucine patch superfamily enzyme
LSSKSHLIGVIPKSGQMDAVEEFFQLFNAIRMFRRVRRKLDHGHYLSIAPSVKLGRDVKLAKFINLYGCEIGDETKIGAFVEIQKNASVEKRCKISSDTFICEGVTIEDNVFIGHGVAFINDSFPRATVGDQLQTEADWEVEKTVVKKGASIGSGCTILANLTIGENALAGGRQCGDERRSPKHDRGGQSRSSIAQNRPDDGGQMSSSTGIPFLDLR